MTTTKRDFPSDRELKSSNPIQFKIFIPSTRNRTIKISKIAFDKRINQMVKVLSRMFGGATIDIEVGIYLFKGKLIKEKVGIITINSTQKKYNYYDEKIERILKEKKKSWGQDSIGFIYQGKMIFV